MSIQHSTATDAALAAKRSAYVDRHKLRDFKLSGRSLMRLVLARCGDKVVVDEVRSRFTTHYGTDLKMESRTWDHLEMFGRDGHLAVLVAHPYHVTAEGREDMALLHRAGLNVSEGCEDESWYGFGTTQIRVEHPWLAGKMLPPPKSAEVVRPADTPSRHTPSAARFPGETPLDARLRRAGPALLALACERAAELTAAIAMVPCAGAVSVSECVHCSLREDYDRVVGLIAEIEFGHSLDGDEAPLFDPEP